MQIASLLLERGADTEADDNVLYTDSVLQKVKSCMRSDYLILRFYPHRSDIGHLYITLQKEDTRRSCHCCWREGPISKRRIGYTL
jgi:hypothetical protein